MALLSKAFSRALPACATLLLALVTVTQLGCKPGEYSAGAEAMTNHFAGSCRSSIGNWTNASLQQTQSLIATLEAVKSAQDKDCAGIAQALQATQAMHQRLSEMVKDPVVNAYRVQEEKKLELVMALARLKSDTNADPELIKGLREELYATELELVRTRAEASTSSDERRRNDVVNGLSDLHQYVLQLLSQGNITACLASAPQMPLGIAASLLTIGGNFTTPLVGTGLAAIGNLMATSVNYMRKLPIEKAGLDLANVQTQAALTCSLEAMSNLYCDAESSYQFIDFALTSYRERGKISDAWRGMDLLGRRIPVLNRWLLKASSGVNPSDKHAAERLNEAWRKQAKLREIRNSAQGEINQTKTLLLGVSDPAEIESREKAGFKNVVYTLYAVNMQGPSEGSPISAFIGMGKAICRLSADPNCVPPTGSWDPSAVIDSITINGGFLAFETRVQALLTEVEKLVTKELLNTINQDPDALVAEATQSTLDNWSVYEVLVAASDFAYQHAAFLKQVPPTTMPGRDRAVVMAEDTGRIFKEVADGIAGAAPSLTVINSTFDKLKLLDGMQFVNNRITQLVRWDLEARIRTGNLPPDVASDLITSGLSLSEQLERAGINLRTDADALVGDIRAAQHTSRENIKITLDIFATTISKLLYELKKSARDAGETDPLDPANRRLAQLCVLALTTSPVLPDKLDLSACRKSKLVSIYRNSGIEVSFDDLRAKLESGKLGTYHQRVCTYSRFLNASKLFQAGRAPTVFSPGIRFFETASWDREARRRFGGFTPFTWQSFKKLPAANQAIDQFILGL